MRTATRILPGLPKQLPAAAKRIVLIPPATVTPSGNDKGTLWVADAEGRARRREVALGAKRPDGQEVLNGLWPTDKIILPDSAPLTEGRRIRISEVD